MSAILSEDWCDEAVSVGACCHPHVAQQHSAIGGLPCEGTIQAMTRRTTSTDTMCIGPFEAKRRACRRDSTSSKPGLHRKRRATVDAASARSKVSNARRNVCATNDPTRNDCPGQHPRLTWDSRLISGPSKISLDKPPCGHTRVIGSFKRRKRNIQPKPSEPFSPFGRIALPLTALRVPPCRNAAQCVAQS